MQIPQHPERLAAENEVDPDFYKCAPGEHDFETFDVDQQPGTVACRVCITCGLPESEVWLSETEPKMEIQYR